MMFACEVGWEEGNTVSDVGRIWMADSVEEGSCGTRGRRHRGFGVTIQRRGNILKNRRVRVSSQSATAQPNFEEFAHIGRSSK